MTDNMKYNGQMVFGLDIGTRSIVGSVGYMEKNSKFNVVAHCVKEHETRAMLDGQIHDIQQVGDSIAFVKRELENQIGHSLNEVCIAAAGRVLKTVTVRIDTDRNDDTAINDEEIYSLDLLGVEKAYELIREEHGDVEFYCVGYTIVRYYMNDYVIGNLEGHKAKKIGADVLATFLPHEVVEGLYSAVNIAGLQVESLTLEPIAAINVAIPEQYRLLNIALLDVGAGTTDICITKDGSVVAYGMIPHAGDEITESIVHKCLVDFNTAEKIKRASLNKRSISYQDIMGLKNKLTAEDIRSIYKDCVNNMTREMAEKIKELNGGKSVNAVFIVGGGGKIHDFAPSIANYLDIQAERVALRGEEVLGDVNFLMEGVKKDPLLVTPIGICINYYDQKNNFIFVNINGQRIKLYDNDRLTVVDVVMQAGISNIDLFPKRGKELTFEVNGQTKTIRGDMGEAAIIMVNDKEANLNSKIIKNDNIVIKPSVLGKAAEYTIEKLAEYKSTLKFYVNGRTIECPKVAEVNGNLVTGMYNIKENDKISIPDFYKLSQLLQFMDIEPEDREIYINGHEAIDDEPIYNEFKIVFNDIKKEEIIENVEDDFDINQKYDDFKSKNEDKSPVVNFKEEETKVKQNDDSSSIIIIVNKTPVTLKNKKSYVFVDIFDFYPFDTRRVAGVELVTTVNGKPCTFMQEIFDGDILELYWRN